MNVPPVSVERVQKCVVNFEIYRFLKKAANLPHPPLHGPLPLQNPDPVLTERKRSAYVVFYDLFGAPKALFFHLQLHLGLFLLRRHGQPIFVTVFSIMAPF